ncbi:MAG: sigma-E factor regulatory protein RseB domain-containing protein [Elusimicrobia bacterium]|nr:sigma-E factor regulatory protein RseB domain-containing protein [Elusimicrobiota bacterium]
MPRTQTFSRLAAAAAAALLCVPAAAMPAAEELLQSALASPTVPYQGKVMVTQWYGKQTSAEEMRVHFSPPDDIRREFLTPDGTVTRITVSDGEHETVSRGGKVVVGDAVRSYEKVMTPEREREILLSNYDLLVSTADKVAGRPVWLLTLKPKIAGKSWQSMALDQETKVVLRVKRYLRRRYFASQASFTSFEPNKPQDEALFHLGATTAAAVAAPSLTPDFMTLEQLAKETGRTSRLPGTLPGGFVFESADVFKAGKSRVAYARYTDGLTVLSVFETERPVRLPKSGVIETRAGFPGVLSASRAGKVLNLQAGGRHYTLMGDLSRELLADVARALK